MIILLWPPGWLILAGLALVLVLTCAETGGGRAPEPPPPPPRRTNPVAFGLGRLLAWFAIWFAGLFAALAVVGYALRLAGW
jgi:hypothetical protein